MTIVRIVVACCSIVLLLIIGILTFFRLVIDKVKYNNMPVVISNRANVHHKNSFLGSERYKRYNCNGSLMVLKNLIKSNTVDFSDTYLLIIQHIKQNSVEFIKLLKSAGFKNIVVIGKPYSIDEDALKRLQEFVTVHTPDYNELESLFIIEKITNPLIEKHEKFACLDLGGYFSRYFHKADKKILGLMGVIEDTKNGIWFGSNQKIQLQFPLLSVASSLLKDYAEHYFVAKTIVRNTENILINTFQQTLTGKKILVCGYGKIGASIAKILKNDSLVSIYDNNSIQQVKAKIDAYTILRNLQNLSDFDVIIGITGNYVLGTELLSLKNDVILVNGSTRQKEFDFSIINNHIKSRENFSTFTRISLDNKKFINVLADGYPVNFHGTESTPEFILDIVFSELFLLLQITCQEALAPGFYPVEKTFSDVEAKVANAWLDCLEIIK